MNRSQIVIGSDQLVGTGPVKERKNNAPNVFLLSLNSPITHTGADLPIFQCCRKFGMKSEAKLVYERFQSQLDDRNLHLFQSTFLG